MIEKLLVLVRDMRDVAVCRASALATASESITKHIVSGHRSRKLHKDIMAGRAPRGRTC